MSGRPAPAPAGTTAGTRPARNTAGTRPARTTAGPRRDNDAADRRLGRVVLVIAAVWAVIIVYVVHSQLPSSTLELPGQDAARSSIRTITPQGWSFFTKSPREPHMVAWSPDEEGGWNEALYAPHSEPRNIFGFNRRSRAQPVEMGLLVGLVPADRWLDCEHGDIPRCLASARPVPVDNPTPQPLLCGPVGISRQQPLPWAWADAADTTHMPATVLRLEVRC